jgi:MFS family permease
MVLWGIGQSTQDMLLQAMVAGVLPEGRRNLAFGLYYTGYGLGWLVGAGVAGLLYVQSHSALVAFAVGVRIASLLVFLLAWPATVNGLMPSASARTTHSARNDRS